MAHESWELTHRAAGLQAVALYQGPGCALKSAAQHPPRSGNVPQVSCLPTGFDYES
jgi:hypothetical protein